MTGKRIPRREIQLPSMETGIAFLEKEVFGAIQQANDDPRVLGSSLQTALIIVGARSYEDPTAARLESWKSVVSAMQIAAAIFSSSAVDEGVVHCRIGDDVRTLPGIGSNPYADPGNWITAFSLAVICRESERLDALADFPISRLRESGAQFDEYIYRWVQALQAYWKRESDLGDKLAAAIEATDPAIAGGTSRELLLKVIYPPMKLFYRFVADEPAKFQDALVECLNLYQEFWTSDEERAHDPDGFIALIPLAIAGIAYDAGFPVDIDSEYLPKHLLDRSWLGEFAT